MTKEPDCDLCEAAKFTHWYFEDDVCWIADCEVCIVPMVVWKQHDTAPDPTSQAHMRAALTRVADERFGTGAWSFDDDMRQIPDHYHAHARDRDWFAKRQNRPLSRFTQIGGKRVER